MAPRCLILCAGSRTHTGGRRNGYTASNESGEKDGACSKEDASSKDGRQGKGRVVNSDRCSASATENRGQAGEGHDYRAQNTTPEFGTQSKGHRLVG